MDLEPLSNRACEIKLNLLLRKDRVASYFNSYHLDTAPWSAARYWNEIKENYVINHVF